ncbi:MAG: 4-phosphoerythronate dehydrogenase [Bacteroidales bacterium]|nr:4-phosphoerythronate dehydrogenase [Bacteroidales bacterium]
MKIVADDRIPFLRGVFEPFAEVVYLPGSQIDAASVRDADALIVRTRTRCGRELLEGSRVKAVASATIGFDHIDTAWCEQAGISWSAAPGCNSGSVAQYVASALAVLATRRGLHFEKMTLGVVGVGHVGTKVAAVGRALGMRVLLNDPPRERAQKAVQANCDGFKERFVSLDEVIAESDIVTLHVPLTKDGSDATWHLFDAERLAMLRQGQILINTSRGEVVDGAALKERLSADPRRACCLCSTSAVLDVWEGEPFIDAELARMVEIGTPHIAGYSADGKAAGTTAAVRFVASQLGLPLEGWCPPALPEPEECRKDALQDYGNCLRLVIDAAGKTRQEVLCEAILATYDIRRDSAALASDFSDFEALRGNYPVRREPGAYRLTLLNSNKATEAALEALGFHL